MGFTPPVAGRAVPRRTQSYSFILLVSFHLTIKSTLQTLEEEFAQCDIRFKEGDVPKPDFWYDRLSH
jgi:hypothetical protein